MRAVIDEIVGLFVDDGFLAAGLLLWCAVAGAGVVLLPSLLAYWGPVLMLGCAAILLASVLRS